MLGDEARVQARQRGLQAQAAAHEARGAREEADPRARHAVAVRDRERGDRVVGELQRRERCERHVGIDHDRAVRHVVDEQQVVLVGEMRQSRQLVPGLDGAVRVQRIDDHDRAGARGDRSGHDVGIEAIAVGGVDRDRDRNRTRGDHRRRHVEVARVRQDDLVAGPGDRHQRQRDARLRALGADDLEAVVAVAAEHARGGVTQRLDEVGAVLVEVLGGDGVAHRAHGARRRPGEARQPAQVGPRRGIQARRSAGIERGGVEADDPDRVAIGQVVPHRVVRALERAQPLGRKLRRGGGIGAPRQDRGAHRTAPVATSRRTKRMTR